MQKRFESQKEQRVIALQKSLSNGKKSQLGVESDSEDSVSDFDTPSVRLLPPYYCYPCVSVNGSLSQVSGRQDEGPSIPPSSSIQDQRIIATYAAKLEDPTVLKAFSKAFFPMLFSSLPEAQDLFEDAIGFSEWRMDQVLKGIIQHLAKISLDETLLHSDHFIERARQYAFDAITESMFAEFNTVFVKSLHQVFGSQFNTTCIRAWANLLETVSYALFLAGEDDEFITMAKLLSSSKSWQKVTVSLTRRKLAIYGRNMKLLSQHELTDVKRVLLPIADQPLCFTLVVADESPLHFMAKSEPDFGLWERELHRSIPNELFSAVASEPPSSSKNGSPKVMSWKPRHSKDGSTGKVSAIVSSCCKAVLQDPTKLQPLTEY